MNDSRTEIITFSRESDNRLQNSRKVAVGPSRIEKSNQCKYLGVKIDKHLDFQILAKNVLKKLAVGIKTIETIQHIYPTTVHLMLFHALVLSHFENSALLLLQITSTYYYR